MADMFIPGQMVFAPPVLLTLAALLRLQGRPVSVQQLVAGLPGGFTPPDVETCLRAAEIAGIRYRLLPLTRVADIPAPTLPCLLVLTSAADGQSRSCVLVRNDPKTRRAQVIFPETDPDTREMDADELEALYTGYALFVTQGQRADPRVESLHLNKDEHWFWGVLREYLPLYRDVGFASLVVNLLSLASPLFIMNVYDRVVPNNAVYTLWVLVLGLMIAHCMEFALRNLRGYFVDVAGRNADVVVASRLVDRILNMRLDNKPESVGGIVNNLREFEQVRDFFGSTTLLALFDLPFLFLFIFIIAYVGGDMVLPVLAALPLMLVFVWLVQRPFQRSVERQYKQSMQKNSLLVEIVGGLETVKSTLAQGHMKRRWEIMVDAAAHESAHTRRLASLAGTGSLFITYVINAAVIIVGVYHITAGTLTQGGLIACVILTGRALSPIMQLAIMLTQMQKARVSLNALQIIMDLPVEQGSTHDAVEIRELDTDIILDHVTFKYPNSPKMALRDVSLRIRKGERVGFVGPTGSGKSTLGRLLVGLYQPTEGVIMLGGVDIRQIDQADLRARIGFMPQDNYLFYGTVRENIAIGCPWQDIRSIVHAAETAGVADFVRSHPQGYDMQVGERGQALSGGQRQAIALARTLVRAPDMLVLDEPSSNLDIESERKLTTRLHSLTAGKTLAIMTHRYSLLSLVDRVVVLGDGGIVADGPRDLVLRSLQTGAIRPPVQGSQAPQGAQNIQGGRHGNA